MKKVLIVLAFSLSLTAWAGVNKFVRDDISPEQQRADKYQCERDARQLPIIESEQIVMYEKCMRVKGYKIALDADGDEIEEDRDESYAPFSDSTGSDPQ